MITTIRNELVFCLKKTSLLSPLTWVSIHVQVLSTSEGKSKAGRETPNSPLPLDHLRRLFAEPLRVSIVDIDQSLLLLPAKWTADRHICSEEEVKSKPLCKF